MSKKSASVKQTKVLQAAISTLPAWGWGLGAVMLVALFFTYYQMVQVQQRLVIGNHELADMRKAVTTAQAARVEMVKEVSSLKESLTTAQAARVEMVKEVSSLKENLTTAQAARVEMVKEVSSLKENLTTAQAARVEMVKEDSSLKENLTVAKTRLSRLEGELKDAIGKLELALAESKKHKIAAEKQQILVQKYEEEAKRAATQPAQ
jgi:chromosome segregation ATPase